mgnify:FL=1|jgi:hypothetical protein|tara:strand:+ start:1209 stop:1724 length:516 start_codon:yes stop_codon:yes gene_type:complete
MATEYTHKKTGENFHILRNTEHVATYNPTLDDVSYTEGGGKYAGPIGKEVSKITQVTPPSEPIEDPKPVAKTSEVQRLRKQRTQDSKLIESLEQEIRELNEQIKSGKKIKAPSGRYKDVVDLTGSPVRSKHLGDLTPDFIEWARNGGFTKEVFLRRYTGRIKDISYKNLTT